MQNRILFALGSLGLAGIAFVYPLLHKQSPHLWSVLSISYSISVLWGLLAAMVLRRVGRKARWILVGLPFCLFWPAVVALITVTCKLGGECF